VGWLVEVNAGAISPQITDLGAIKSEKIGEGSTSVVFKGRYNQQQVAVKRPKSLRTRAL